MPGQTPHWTDFLSCEVCSKLFSENANPPISLGCGHTVCKFCLSQLRQNKCPFDQSPISCDIDKLPVNYALLQLVGAAIPDKVIDAEITDVSNAKKTEYYEAARKCIEELAVYLKPLSEDSINELEKNNEDLTDLKVNKASYNQRFIQTHHGRMVSASPGNSCGCTLSRPMQRKLLVLINCQLVEEEGRSRAARAARSLGERSVTELILAHQNPQQLSANLWAAVRTRGCQFLGPGMQEEVLKLILLALEDGSALSRKVLVLFVVQRLEKQYPQASKTAIGHVVQLLYRASCFKVTKRDEESSLMQLKEEFRNYEALRLEHDAQIVQIAIEAGLRISPEQWSSLLYGDATHKSHMQSIIDKHQSPQSFTQGINELVLVLQRSGDPSNLCSLRPHLDFLSKIDPSPDCPAPSWEDLAAVMKSLKIVIQGLVDFVMRFNSRRQEAAQPQNSRYKTSMCRDFVATSSCPRAASCTFAHSQDELEQYRCRSKKMTQRGFGQAASAFSPKQKTGETQIEEFSQDQAAHIQSGDAQERERVAGGLTPSMAGLSISPSLHPQVADRGDMLPPPGLPQSSPAPPPPHNSGGLFPVVHQGMGMSRSGMRMPYGTLPGLPEGMRGDQVPANFPPQAMGGGGGNGGGGNAVLLHSHATHAPSELGVPYQGSSLTPHHLSQSIPGTPRSHPPPLNPLPHPPTHMLSQMPARMPEMVASLPPCVHQEVFAARNASSMYPVGRMVGGGGPLPSCLPDSYMYGPGTDLQAAAVVAAAAGGSMPPVQSLEKLQNRKSELISHLQSEGDGPARGTIGRRKLDRVLAAGPRSAVNPLFSSVNNTFVAMRTTNTLDDLDADSLQGIHQKGDYLNGSKFSVPVSQASQFVKGSAGEDVAMSNGMATTVQIPSTFMSSHAAHPVTNPERYQAPQCNQKSVSSQDDFQEDLEVKKRDLKYSYVQGHLVATLDNEDDFIIPFDPPLVSKFGPISRNARVKARDSSPVQVTAEERVTKCTPVLTVTPLHRPYPTSAPVPSLYKPRMSTGPALPVSMPAPLQTPRANVYLPHSGGRCQIPEMVDKLERSAIRANTTSERLALQLQSVELQISMKTGEKPRPVSQLLEEATSSDRSMLSIAEDITAACLQNFGTEWK